MNALKHLQSAPSQKAVDDIFLLAFTHRDQPIAQAERKIVSETLNITPQDSQDVRVLLRLEPERANCFRDE